MGCRVFHGVFHTKEYFTLNCTKEEWKFDGNVQPDRSQKEEEEEKAEEDAAKKVKDDDAAKKKVAEKEIKGGEEEEEASEVTITSGTYHSTSQ